MFSIPILPCFLLLSLFLKLNDSDVVYRFLHTNQYERVGGVGFDTPQVIRPASHQNRAPPGLGDCKSIAFPLVSHSPQITKIMMRKIIYYYGISSLSDAPFFPCPFLKEIALQLRTEHPWDEIIIKTPSYDDVQHFHSPGVRNHLSR